MTRARITILKALIDISHFESGEEHISSVLKGEGAVRGNPDAQWGQAGGPYIDIPCIVLDPEVSAKLHGLVCGAELWMGTAQVNT